MAFFRGTIRSQVLSMSVHMNVILPENQAPQGTMLLLHGLSGNADDWMRLSSVERYAREYALAVFMPEVQRSWYIDMAYGLRYFTFVSDELPRQIAAAFRVPTQRERFLTAGLSMGGYGAMKCALTYPERFGGCIALSSSCYMAEKVRKKTVPVEELIAVLGADLTVREADDLEALGRRAARAPEKPRLYMACGTEDGLHAENVRLSRALRAEGLELQYEEWPGVHDWAFWDEGIRRGLKALLA